MEQTYEDHMLSFSLERIETGPNLEVMLLRPDYSNRIQSELSNWKAFMGLGDFRYVLSLPNLNHIIDPKL